MPSGITVEFCHRGDPDLPGFSNDRGCAWSSRNIEAVVDFWRVTLQNDGMKAVGWLKGESRLIPESDNGVLLEMSSIPFDSAAAMQKSDDQREGLDVIGFLRRRKSFVLLLGICGAIVFIRGSALR